MVGLTPLIITQSKSSFRVNSLGYGLIALATALAPPTSARAYTYQKLYDFCSQQNCVDGGTPAGRLVMDSEGNLYGVAETGAATDSGAVFELVRSGSTYSYTVLYNFCTKNNCADGGGPEAGLVLDVNGNLYGTTSAGGMYGAGTIFELKRPVGKGGSWKVDTLHSFCNFGCGDGAYPQQSLTYQGQESGALYDGVSPLYGTTEEAGIGNNGVAFQYTPGSHNSHGPGRFKPPSSPFGPKYSIIYTFCSLANCADGSGPREQLTVDGSGNLYGTTEYGGQNSSCNDGDGCGTLFELSPSGSVYTESVLYSFCSSGGCADGEFPDSAVTLTNNGLLGLTTLGGQCNAGLLFRLAQSNGTWQEAATSSFCTTTGTLPAGKVLLNGDLYGVASYGGSGGNDGPNGTVWTESGEIFQVLYNFCSQPDCSDGFYPQGGVIADASGNLFGVTQGGSAPGAPNVGGTVFELSP